MHVRTSKEQDEENEENLSFESYLSDLLKLEGLKKEKRKAGILYSR